MKNGASSVELFVNFTDSDEYNLYTNIPLLIFLKSKLLKLNP